MIMVMFVIRLDYTKLQILDHLNLQKWQFQYSSILVLAEGFTS